MTTPSHCYIWNHRVIIPFPAGPQSLLPCPPCRRTFQNLIHVQSRSHTRLREVKLRLSQLPGPQLSNQQAALFLRLRPCLRPRQVPGLPCCLHHLSSCPGSFQPSPGCSACALLWDPSPALRPCPGLGPCCPLPGLDSTFLSLVFPFPAAPAAGKIAPALGTCPDSALTAGQRPPWVAQPCYDLWPTLPAGQAISTWCHGALEGSPGKLGPALCSRGRSKGKTNTDHTVRPDLFHLYLVLVHRLFRGVLASLWT